MAELIAGVRAEEEARTEALIFTLECLSITKAIANKAGLIRRTQRRQGRTVALDDLMIAGTAIFYEIPLITDNLKDFDIPELKHYPR